MEGDKVIRAAHGYYDLAFGISATILITRNSTYILYEILPFRMGLEADPISVSPPSLLTQRHALSHIHQQTRVDLPIIRVDIIPQPISVFGTTDVQGSIFEGQY